MGQSATARLVAVDRVKAWAILAVLLTHAFAPRTVPPLGFHVPGFLLVTGLLCEERMSWHTLGRRLRRVLVPYAVASAAVYALGIVPFTSLRDVAFRLVTGSVLGPYYYVPVLVVCLLTLWPLSRVPRVVRTAITSGLACYVIAGTVWPWLQRSPHFNFFWGIRDPLWQFSLGYMLVGWLTGRALLAAPVTLAIPFALVGWALMANVRGWFIVGRIAYTLGALPVLARVPAPGMAFLSRATLGLYLWHEIILSPIRSLGVRDPLTLFAAALVGTSAFVLIAERLLGRERARTWIG
jgi:peptidoglycan/LPS O-acetylase OafA/YrhL